MLAEALLKNRVLEAVCEKNCKPRAPQASRPGGRGQGDVFRAGGVQGFAARALHLLVSCPAAFFAPAALGQAPARALRYQHPRYGYRRIAALLRQEGWPVGKRQVQRLRRAEGLRVPPTRRKVVRRGISTGLPTRAVRRGHVWTWDFVSDATVRGGAIRMLTILDEHTRLVSRFTCRPGATSGRRARVAGARDPGARRAGVSAQ
jgi:hypothetical protein